MRVSAEDIRALLHSRIESPEKYEPIGSGLGAAPGAIHGKVVFQPIDAVASMKNNESVILVRPETSPDDIQGISVAVGVLTSRGGLTSHAAIVTRAMGKPCICGAEDVEIDLEAESFQVNGTVVKKGDSITIDGNTGNIYLGSLPLFKASGTEELDELLTLADSYRRLGVRANAETPEGIALAIEHGAEGIGLCRTERQFNEPDRLIAIRAYILAETDKEKKDALDVLRQLQVKDFIAIFKALKGIPIIIRLLDIPLHEFLPAEEETKDRRMKRRIRELRETNPMLGHRGVRVAVTSPEIYQMQIDAICQAMKKVKADVSVMIPQVAVFQEILWVKQMVQDKRLKVGTMMETVRACMRADRFAEVADFFSFGTNDLTQAVWSFSREDAERKFMSSYIEKDIIKENPFQILDRRGVGRLMEMAVIWARTAKTDLEIGVCGEHAGEPLSIRFFHRIGIDYVSCSPFRIPVAKLVAAQVAIEEKSRK